MSSASYSSAGWYEQVRAHTLPPSLFFVAALMASIPLENSAVLPAVGSISRLVGALAAGAVIIDAAIALGFRRPHPGHVPLALFVVWNAWTCFWSVNPALSAGVFTTYVQLLLLVWLIWQSVRDLRHLRMLLMGFVLGSCSAVVLTIINLQNLKTIAGAPASRGSLGRFSDPNELGLTLVLTLPMTYYLFTTARTWRGRVFWLLPIPLCLTGVVLTVSRGAFIATAVALLGISLWHVTSAPRMRFAPLIAGALLLVVGMASAPEASLKRFASIEDELLSGRVGKRTPIWRVGMDLFRQRPLTGIGAATFGYASAPLQGKDIAAHNVYVSVLTETGIIGFLIFSVALGMFFITALHLGFSERFLWLTVMVIWCVGVMSLTWEYKKATWSIFALLIATAGVSEPVRPARSNPRLTKYRMAG